MTFLVQTDKFSCVLRGEAQSSTIFRNHHHHHHLHHQRHHDNNHNHHQLSSTFSLTSSPTVIIGIKIITSTIIKIYINMVTILQGEQLQHDLSKGVIISNQSIVLQVGIW